MLRCSSQFVASAVSPAVATQGALEFPSASLLRKLHPRTVSLSPWFSVGFHRLPVCNGCPMVCICSLNSVRVSNWFQCSAQVFRQVCVCFLKSPHRFSNVSVGCGSKVQGSPEGFQRSRCAFNWFSMVSQGCAVGLQGSPKGFRDIFERPSATADIGRPLKTFGRPLTLEARRYLTFVNLRKNL